MPVSTHRGQQANLLTTYEARTGMRDRHNTLLWMKDLIEHMERTARIDHEVFRDDLEPIDGRLLRQDVLVMRHAQADADAVIGEIIETIGRHVKGKREEVKGQR